MGEMRVTASGQHVTLSPGDRVTVLLDEHATAGYEWTVDRIDGGLTLEASTAAASSARPGAPAERRVVFRATSVGDARVELTLQRSWERERYERFTFTAVVTADRR